MTKETLITSGIVAAIALIIIVIQAILNKMKLAKSDLAKKILDTSVIIDGRILDIARSGFLEGIILVPRFVLQELQLIADSSDGMKRSKGRRGLDLLNEFKKIPGINVVIMDKDYNISRKVDEKLIAMAQDIPGSKIITNDYNLNKIAEIQGIKVLNINDLSNAIKPTFLPGEKINVKIMKEGKEKEQGIAYLTDGTMIVVDGARRMMNKNIYVVVTNVLQTDAGRMIFARFEEGGRPSVEGGQGGRDNRGRDNNRGGRDNSRGGFNRNRGGRNRGGRDNRNNYQSQGNQSQNQGQNQNQNQSQSQVQNQAQPQDQYRDQNQNQNQGQSQPQNQDQNQNQNNNQNNQGQDSNNQSQQNNQNNEGQNNN